MEYVEASSPQCAHLHPGIESLSTGAQDNAQERVVTVRIANLSTATQFAGVDKKKACSSFISFLASIRTPPEIYMLLCHVTHTVCRVRQNAMCEQNGTETSREPARPSPITHKLILKAAGTYCLRATEQHEANYTPNCNLNTITSLQRLMILSN